MSLLMLVFPHIFIFNLIIGLLFEIFSLLLFAFYHISVQKIGNTVGLTLLSLEKSDFKIGPWLAFGNLDFKSVLIIPNL